MIFFVKDVFFFDFEVFCCFFLVNLYCRVYDDVWVVERFVFGFLLVFLVMFYGEDREYDCFGGIDGGGIDC